MVWLRGCSVQRRVYYAVKVRARITNRGVRAGDEDDGFVRHDEQERTQHQHPWVFYV
ncbi:hypothetical protein V7S43_002117 [Phytophthora oleae]|uniref:Uncharacterized protein n=1 Tax=Phytophthora oleae TaxID=2107226 RepID=A0ABD3G6S1_9STRA